MKKTDVKQRENYTELDQRIRKLGKNAKNFATTEDVNKVQQNLDKIRQDTTAADQSAKQARADALAAKELAEAARKAADLAAKQAEQAQKQAEVAQAESEQAKQQADTALTDSRQAKNAAELAAQSAQEAFQTVQQAKQTVEKAQTMVADIENSVEEIQNSVSDAQTFAENAQHSAVISQEKADRAEQSASTARQQAALAKTAAETAEENSQNAVQQSAQAVKTSDAAKQSADKATENVNLIKQDVRQQEKDLAEYKNKLDTLSNTMENSYAKKTELTEVESSLKSTIEQNAAGFNTTVEELKKIDETNSRIARQARQQAQAAQELAQRAQQKADTATENATNAQKAADQAATAAGNAQAQAKVAQDAATASRSAAQQAEEDLKTAQDELAAIRFDVLATKEDVAAAEQAVKDAQTAVETAREQASRSAQKAADAQSAADTATQKATVAQRQADAAALSAIQAQQQATAARGSASAAAQSASEALETAANAQQVADTAKVNAEQAQKDARTATQKAQIAETTAQQANAEAQQAATDLETAKENLVKVEADINATNEELATAKQAVETAQMAANTANANAQAAQQTANTAKQNAATAQTAANNAATAASNAQIAANAAKTAADKAQAAVDSLTARVTTAETNITQNAEQIALRATKTEVTQALSGYYTKTQTEALIKVEADKITNQATEIDDLTTRMSTVEQTASGLTVKITTAQNTADAAKSEATNAAQTATNYLNFSSTGLVVGDMTASTLGKNVLIYSGGVDIRDNTAVLASFKANAIELGKNSDSAYIYLCNATGSIYVDKSTDFANFLTFKSTKINLRGEYLSLYSEKADISSIANVVAVTDTEGSYLSIAAQNKEGVGYAFIRLTASPYGKNGTIYFEVESESKGKQVLSLTPLDGLLLQNADFIFYSAGTQSKTNGLKWSPINSKSPYIGYASDQTDGTFVWSITGTNYASGLAIGGDSGNLLYKGKVVLTASNYSTYAPPKAHASTATTYGAGTGSNYGHVKLSDSTSSTSGASAGIAASPAAVKAAYDKANHSHPYLPLAGGTVTGASTFSSTLTTSGRLIANGSIRLPNDGILYGLSSSGSEINMLQMNASNHIMLGCGGYLNSIGATYVDGNVVNIRSKGKILLTGHTEVTGNISSTGVGTFGSVELFAATPYIDFHFGNSTADYTTRIIEGSKGALTVQGTLSQTSDRRIKENIMPLGIEQLMVVDDTVVQTDLHSELFDRLRPVQYNFIKGNGRISYGLIAQDVLEAMREVGIDENSLDLVYHNFWTEKNGQKKEQYSISYNNIIALLVHEMQKMKSEIKSLKS